MLLTKIYLYVTPACLRRRPRSVIFTISLGTGLGGLAKVISYTLIIIKLLLSSSCFFTPCFGLNAAAEKHCGFKWVKYARNEITWCDFTSFSKQFSADLHHFRFLFLCTSHSKLVKLLQTQVWPLNFTNFSNVIFGGFLQLVPNVNCTAKLRASLPTAWRLHKS